MLKRIFIGKGPRFNFSWTITYHVSDWKGKKREHKIKWKSRWWSWPDCNTVSKSTKKGIIRLPQELWIRQLVSHAMDTACKNTKKWNIVIGKPVWHIKTRTYALRWSVNSIRRKNHKQLKSLCCDEAEMSYLALNSFYVIQSIKS